MILKEFAVDFPYTPQDEQIHHLMHRKKLSREEAVLLDYQENWKWNRRKYSLQTRCVTALFERLFPGIQTDGIWKLLVECVPVVENRKIHKSGGILSIQIALDLPKFLSGNESEKQRITLDLVMQAAGQAALAEAWDFSVFEQTAEGIRILEYRNEWVWKKVKNRKTGFLAEVICRHSVQSLDLFIAIKDPQGLVNKETKILSEQPDEFAYAKHLGALQWTENHTVQLINKNGECVGELQASITFEILEKLHAELEAFYSWAGSINPGGEYDPVQVHIDDVYLYPRWDDILHLTYEAVKILSNKYACSELIEIVLQVMALDHEDEDVLDRCEEELHAEAALNLTKYGVEHPCFETRWQIAEFIRRKNDPLLKDYLVFLLKDTHTYVQRRALLAMVEIDPSLSVEHAWVGVKDEDFMMRLVSLRILDDLSSGYLIEALELLVDDSHSIVLEEVEAIKQMRGFE